MNNTEIVVTLIEVELALSVANARWALVDSAAPTELDNAIVDQVLEEMYSAGNRFNYALYGLMVANIVYQQHPLMDTLLYDIRARLHAFPQHLRDAFFVALD